LRKVQSIAVSELLERFRRIVTDAADRPLIYRAAFGDVLTAGDLWDRAEYLQRLIANHAAPARPILSLCGNAASGISLLLAARRLEMPVLPVDLGATGAEVESLLRRFQPGLIVGALTALPSQVREPVALDEGLGFVRLEIAADSPCVPQEVAVMKLSSGSSGPPRATLTSDANLVADGTSIIEAMDIRAEDVQIAFIPLSHAYGLGNLVLPLLLQATAIVTREGFAPQQFPQDAVRYGASMFPGVPFMFDHLAEHLSPDRWPPSVTRLISAGAPLEAPTVQRFHRKFGLKIHSFYGTTETGGICYDDDPAIDVRPTVGRPMPGVQVTLHPHDATSPTAGRVHVAGAAVVSGYLADPVAVADTEDTSPFLGGGFLTGDIGAFDARGHLTLQGRVSSFVNVAGRKVQPKEVEDVLRQAPGVADVRVVGAPDPRRGEQLVACVVVSSDRVEPAVLREFCSARLASFKVPRQYVFLDRIPLTERGKTDRLRLDAIVRDYVSRLV
jgi:acyl-CoA synthetase (AMP-forming)/AMP-acid ligase II